MKENAREYILLMLQRTAPFFVSLFFIFFEHILLNSDISNVRPMFGFICVFFWVFNRPDIFNLFSVALLGVFCDFLNYTPMGTYLLGFLLFYLMETKISKYISNKYFVVNFIAFSILLLMVTIAQWVILCIYYKAIIPFIPSFISWILTICFYPLISAVNLKISAVVLPEEDFE